MSHLTIALDIMGGDHGPLIILAAAKAALIKHPQLKLLLCGDGPLIERQIQDWSEDLRQKVTCIPTSQVVSMQDLPTQALKNKKDSSMRKAIDLVEQGDAAACVSAGNTGALMAIAYYVLRTLPGIDRPALISSLPTASQHKVYLLDLGANVNSDSDTLLQFAVMGAVMAETVSGVAHPRVALLNVGEEQIKGHEKIKYAASLLADAPHINYTGYIEGNDIFTDKADVVVTDGFVGNIALKSCEGLGKLVISEVKRASAQNLLTRIMAKLALPLLRTIYSRVNPDQYNGASLIGLRGIVVKSHGNANSDAFLYAIEEAIQEARRQVPEKIKDKIESVLMERA